MGESKGESNLASNQFPMCSPQSGTLREVHRVIWRREEKREEGNRGDQEEKSGNQKGREQSSQQSIPYLLSTVWNTQKGSWNYIEKRRGRKEIDQEERRGSQKERDQSRL